MHARPASRRALVSSNRRPQRPVGQSTQARAVGFSTSDAVVGDVDDQVAVARHDPDRRA